MYSKRKVLLHSTYTSTVDIWSCGCIFAELYMRRPLFIGQTDIDQLYKIFEIMGVPEDETKWPNDACIPLRSFATSPKLADKPKLGLHNALANTMVDADALELLACMLDFDLNARISAYDALKHSYFQRAETATTATATATTAAAATYLSASLPDITNLFQHQQHQQQAQLPNILKRKRINNNMTANNKS